MQAIKEIQKSTTRPGRKNGTKILTFMFFNDNIMILLALSFHLYIEMLNVVFFNIKEWEGGASRWHGD